MNCDVVIWLVRTTTFNSAASETHQRPIRSRTWLEQLICIGESVEICLGQGSGGPPTNQSCQLTPLVYGHIEGNIDRCSVTNTILMASLEFHRIFRCCRYRSLNISTPLQSSLLYLAKTRLFLHTDWKRSRLNILHLTLLIATLLFSGYLINKVSHSGLAVNLHGLSKHLHMT